MVVLAAQQKENNMLKLYNIHDISAFFKVIDECKDRVELVSSDGDCINLKSKLAQFVSLSSLFSDSYISEVELKVYDEEDQIRLMRFMYNGNH